MQYNLTALLTGEESRNHSRGNGPPWAPGPRHTQACTWQKCGPCLSRGAAVTVSSILNRKQNQSFQEDWQAVSWKKKQESKTFTDRFYKPSKHKNDAKQVMISDMSCFSHLTS